MCNLSWQKFLAVAHSQPVISKKQSDFSSCLASDQAALKAKNDRRAFALLKAIAQTQVISGSSSLSDYPRISAAIAARAHKT